MITGGLRYSVNMETPRLKAQIPEVNKESLILMMKEIMANSLPPNDQLHCVVQESNELSESMVENLLIDQLEQEKVKEVVPQIDTHEGKQCEIESSQVETAKQVQHAINHLEKNRTSYHALDSSKSDNKLSSISKNLQESVLNSNQIIQFDKLIEITSRCVEYYNNFIKQKSAEFSIIQKTFTDLSTNLDITFDEIISEAQKKRNQLKQFLIKKHNQIIEYRQSQDNGLKDKLQSIRSVHLNNIMKKQKNFKQPQIKDSKQKMFISLNSKLQNSSTKHGDSENLLLNSYLSSQSDSLSIEVHNYATTLNQFYLQMEEIEKSNFKEIVEQSVSFINNLISEELKILMTQKIPSKLSEKRILISSSKDFLMEENQNQAKINNGDYLAFLDFQSFTKLFTSNTKLINGDQEVIQDNKKFEQLISLIQQKNNSQVKEKSNFMKQKVLTNRNQNNQKNQKSLERKLSSKPKTIYHVTTVSKKQNTLITNRPSSKSLQKTTNLRKKQNTQSTKKFEKNLNEDVHKQNSLQLIKKISSQQNNRSAKIQNYMINFQDNNKKKVTLRANENKQYEGKLLNKTHSKSPSNVLSKTPIKNTKSYQKKSLVSSQVINMSNQSKFKTSQQTSLKSSRNISYVSDFFSKKQSVALK